MFAQNKSIAHYTSLKVKHSVLFLSAKYKTYIRLAEQGFLANANGFRRFIFSLAAKNDIACSLQSVISWFFIQLLRFRPYNEQPLQEHEASIQSLWQPRPTRLSFR